MSSPSETAVQTGRKKVAQGKERSDATLGHASQNTSSPQGAKECGWPVVPLGEIAEVKLGKMLDKAKHQTGQRLPYLRNVNVRWGAIETDDLLEMNFEEDQLDRFGLKANDVLVCEGGEPGRASVWNGHLPNLKFQKALHRVRFKASFDPRLLVYLLELLAKNGGLERRFTGSTIKHFTREAFVQLPIPFPPEAEQRRIVAEIEKQFTRLEAGVAALRRVQANLKRYRAAVLKAACEGKLVPTEHELAKSEGRSQKDENKRSKPADSISSFFLPPSSFESGEALLARILTERRQKWQGRGQYKEPAAPNVTKLGQLPEGWTWAVFDQISTLITKGSSPNWQGFNYSVDGIIFVRSENVRWGTLDLNGVAHLPVAFNEKERKSILREGDVLLNLVGASIGRAAIATAEVDGGNVNQAVAVIRLVAKKTLNQFAMLWLNSSDAQKRIHAEKVDVARANFSLEDTRVLPFPLPPLAEQTRIVAEVERRLSVVVELEAVVSANLQRATRLRQSILQKAFTGGL